jgi:hypothetical protein
VPYICVSFVKTSRLFNVKTLLRSLASAEDALQYNHTGDWVAMRELLVDIVSNQDSSHKSVKSTEDLHLQPRNKKSWTLCALISAYRLVDIAKMVENLPNRISVPLHVRQKVLFKETHKVCVGNLIEAPFI